MLVNVLKLYSDYEVLSEFTVALLEDSGWYKANYTALNELNQFPLQWGKGLSVSKRIGTIICNIILLSRFRLFILE